MIIGVIKESRPCETRVAATPGTVEPLRKLGYEVVVEVGAGEAAGVEDVPLPLDARPWLHPSRQSAPPGECRDDAVDAAVDRQQPGLDQVEKLRALQHQQKPRADILRIGGRVCLKTSPHTVPFCVGKRRATPPGRFSASTGSGSRCTSSWPGSPRRAWSSSRSPCSGSAFPTHPRRSG